MDLEAAAAEPREIPWTADRRRAIPSSVRDTYSFRRDTARNSPGGLAPWRLARVRRHIELHLTSKLTNSGLAALVRLNEDHFARAFKASVGRPPHTYVVERRIEHAKSLLLGSHLSLCQIALAVGFADQAHLTRRFRETVGVSPASWRRRSEIEESRSGGQPWSH